MGTRIRCDDARLLGLVADGLTNKQVAASIGVTTRTVDRWRATRPALNTKINRVRAALRAATAPCGTLRAYRRGCKCQACRTANADYCRPYQVAARARRRSRAES